MLFDLVKAMRAKSNQLVTMTHDRMHSTSSTAATHHSSDMMSEGIEGEGTHFAQTDGNKLSIAAAERLADSLDEDVHRLQYLVDHCRRLLEGSAVGGNFSGRNEEEEYSGDGGSELISLRRSKHLERGVKQLFDHATRILHVYVHMCIGIGIGIGILRCFSHLELISYHIIS